MADAILVMEGSAAQYTTTLRDQAGAAVPLTNLATLTLTLYDADTGTVIHGRSAQNVKNANGGTYTGTSGLFTMTFDALDTALVTETAEEEQHLAIFEATWIGGGGGVNWPVSLWVQNLDRTPVIRPPLQANALLTMAEGRRALGLTTADDHEQLAPLINAVSDRWEQETGRKLASRTYTDEYRLVDPLRVYGGAWFDIEAPITAMATLELDGTAQTVWLPGIVGEPGTFDCAVPESRDRLVRASGWPTGSLVKRTYTAGYGGAFPLPSDLREAVAETLRHYWYASDRQKAGVASRSAGAETITYITAPLPLEVIPVIKTYKRVVT